MAKSVIANNTFPKDSWMKIFGVRMYALKELVGYFDK
jgi:hypothetical protein